MRAARAASLFIFIQLIILLISGVVVSQFSLFSIVDDDSKIRDVVAQLVSYLP